MMTLDDSFKVGYLAWCADQGMDEEQTRAHIKKAMSKEAFFGPALGRVVGAPIDFAKALMPYAIPLGIGAGIGVPVAAGLTGGYLAAKATQDDTSVDEAKTDEELSEYRRLTDQALRQTAAKRLQGVPTVGGHLELSQIRQ